MNARHKLSEMGFEVETLCFDGLMCLKQDINKEQLEELNAFCFDRTGYNVEFEIKPMNDFIKIKEKEPEEITIKETEYYDQLYCSRLKSYNSVKEYVERYLYKIITPDVCFIFQNGNDKDLHIYNMSTVSTLLQPIDYEEESEDGKTMSYPFFKKWLMDPNQRIYRKYDFIPFNITPPDTDVFNMFLGMNSNIYGKPSDNPDKM